MKPFLFTIVAVAILLGLRQHGDHARLLSREKELRTATGLQMADPAIKEAISASGATSNAGKIGRSGKPKFDAKSYLAEFKKLILIAMLRDLGPGEDDLIRNGLLDATAEDLLQLPEAIREAGVQDNFASVIYESASTRLIDKAPASACEFALKGGDITSFLLVIRTWISRDPVAAGEWLEMRSKAEPPLNEKSIDTHASHREPLDVPRLQLAARIAAAPSGADLGGLTELEGRKLAATLDDVLKVLSPEDLPVFLKRLNDSGREDLVKQAIAQHPEPALAREYLKSAGLPPATFAKAAQVAISQLDPASLPAGMDWYLRDTDPKSRGPGLRSVVKSWTQENPRSAAAWIATLPQSEDRTQAEAAYRDALAHPRPKELPDR
ncbi:hypothetical protein [Luteolibacter sp. Populi]|uniref:hypothetical protein n=1 Tax=Luteolibacter sp. Populi TaxID=3230487 RepID=UPI0034655542